MSEGMTMEVAVNAPPPALAEKNPSPRNSKRSSSKVRSDFPCTFDGCNRTFASKWGVTCHLETHKDKRDRKRFKCDHCERTYCSKSDKLKHMRKAHNFPAPGATSLAYGGFAHPNLPSSFNHAKDMSMINAIMVNNGWGGMGVFNPSVSGMGVVQNGNPSDSNVVNNGSRGTPPVFNQMGTMNSDGSMDLGAVNAAVSAAKKELERYLNASKLMELANSFSDLCSQRDTLQAQLHSAQQQPGPSLAQLQQGPSLSMNVSSRGGFGINSPIADNPGGNRALFSLNGNNQSASPTPPAHEDLRRAYDTLLQQKQEQQQSQHSGTTGAGAGPGGRPPTSPIPRLRPDDGSNGHNGGLSSGTSSSFGIRRVVKNKVIESLKESDSVSSLGATGLPGLADDMSSSGWQIPPRHTLPPTKFTRGMSVDADSKLSLGSAFDSLQFDVHSFSSVDGNPVEGGKGQVRGRGDAPNANARGGIGTKGIASPIQGGFAVKRISKSRELAAEDETSSGRMSISSLLS